MFGIRSSGGGVRLLVGVVGMRGRQLVTGGEVTSWIDGTRVWQLVIRGKITSWIDENKGSAASN